MQYPHVEELHFHKEEGAGHWWNGDASEGVDCVDWPPLFEFMSERSLDPDELEFDFVSPGPQVSSRHTYVTVRSTETPLRDFELHSMPQGDDAVALDTDNVRSMVLDGAALRRKGIARVMVDGDEHEVPEGPLEIGPSAGKQPLRHGPFHEVFYRPFCYVYPDDNQALAAVAAYYTSQWNLYGNGHACALPRSRLTEALRAERNLVHLGGDPSLVAELGWPFDWNEAEVRIGENQLPRAAIMLTFPEGERLSAILAAAVGEEPLLYRVVPFSSRGTLPDFLLWNRDGGIAAGFFDSEWGWDPSLAVP